MSKDIESPIGRVAFPNLRTARAMNEQAKPKFSITLVWGENVDLTEIRNAVDALIKEKYPKGAPPKFRYPIQNAIDKLDNAGERVEGFGDTEVYADFWKYEDRGPVPVVDGLKNDLLPGDVYGGMFARVLCHPFLYDVSGNVGAAFSLGAVQKARDGEPIGFAPTNTDDFGSLEEDSIEGVLN